MYILRSIMVLLFILALLVASIYLVNKYRVYKKNGIHHLKYSLSMLLCVLCTVIFIVLFGDYTYPFERTLHPILIAEFQVPEGYEHEYPGERYWHGAYKKWGLYAESFYFNPENTDPYGIGWPPMDFDNYSYIITYGQKIKSLSYNVWDVIEYPFMTGAKVGHMILEDEFSPDTVYIYQIPLIRIENDRNDMNSPWD